MDVTDVMFWGAIGVGLLYLIAQFTSSEPNTTISEPLQPKDLGSRISPNNPTLGWIALGVVFFVFGWPLLKRAQRKVETSVWGENV